MTAYKMRQTLPKTGTDAEAPPMPTVVKHRTIVERADTDATVGDPLMVKDDDEGHEVYFEIESGNEDGKFRISKCNGQIFTLTDDLDFKIKNRYELLLNIYDDPEKFKVRLG